MATWVIIGAGYTGSALARRLVGEGHDVVVTRREPAAATAVARALGTPRARGVAVDLAIPATLGALADDAIVVCTAPPGADPAGELAAVVERAARLVYLSSTAVYGPARGAWVDESWPVAPTTQAGRGRAAAEAVLGPRAVALRVAGIYGPSRGLVDRIRAGTYRIVGDGSAHISRIHVVDLIEAIVRAGTSMVTGPINVADDDPAPIGTIADAIAAQLGVPPPPRVPVDGVDAELAGMLNADRRIANQRMKRELGVVLRFASVLSAGASATTP